MYKGMPERVIIHTMDEDLVAEIIVGNPLALQSLFDKYASFILGLIRQSKVTEDKVDEVLITCFMYIRNDMGEFDPAKKRLFTWILLQARKAIRDVGSDEKTYQQIQAKLKYVKDNSTSTNRSGKLLGLLMTEGYSYEELSGAMGVTRKELMTLVREEVNQMKKSF
jgi:hypothetical protein